MDCRDIYYSFLHFTFHNIIRHSVIICKDVQFHYLFHNKPQVSFLRFLLIPFWILEIFNLLIKISCIIFNPSNLIFGSNSKISSPSCILYVFNTMETKMKDEIDKFDDCYDKLDVLYIKIHFLKIHYRYVLV